MTRLGAWFEPDGSARWRVWAPNHKAMEVVLMTGPDAAPAASIPLSKEGEFFSGKLPSPGERVLYKLRVDGAGPFPDPWSRSQPFGVHGPTELAKTSFEWHDAAWTGCPRNDLIIEEFHVGTATTDGTFDALIAVLGHVRLLGATAIELMPVASFPGARNWGYDGVSYFAPSAAYGGADGLRRFVDAAHQAGIAVILDVVYNHFGPDGNYLACYSDRYFTSRHRTPWGDGINYDGEGREVVRELILSNVEMWIRDFHLDGLRLDATHAIVDDSQPHILEEIATRAHAAAPNRSVVVIAEDDRNETRLLRPKETQGFGLDAVWADDFHHGLRRRMAGDSDGYFQDFSGAAADLARTISCGWLFQGEQSRHFGRARGTNPAGLHPRTFVHCIQNHDQIGNRAMGDRLQASVTPEQHRVMAALLLLGTGTPLLFMGQEWNATTPFLYFTDHNEELGRAVTEGRRREFQSFSGFAGADIPDPQAEWTFFTSKLDWTEMVNAPHAAMLAWYRALVALRRTHPALSSAQCVVDAPDANTVRLRYSAGEKTLTLIAVLEGQTSVRIEAPLLLSSESPQFDGHGAMAVHGGKLVGEGPAALVFGG